MTTKKGVSVICELWNTFMIFFFFLKNKQNIKYFLIWVKSVLISVNDQLIIMNIKVLILLNKKNCTCKIFDIKLVLRLNIFM